MSSVSKREAQKLFEEVFDNMSVRDYLKSRSTTLTENSTLTNAQRHLGCASTDGFPGSIATLLNLVNTQWKTGIR